MIKEYFSAANKVIELANECTDPDVISILRTGSDKIFKLAQDSGSIIKEANLKEEQRTGTE